MRAHLGKECYENECFSRGNTQGSEEGSSGGQELGLPFLFWAKPTWVDKRIKGPLDTL